MVGKVWGKRSGERKVRNSTPCASTLDGFSFKRSRDTRRVRQAGSNKGESLKYSPITDTAAFSAQRDTGTTAGTRGLLAASTRMGAEPQTPSGPSFPRSASLSTSQRHIHRGPISGATFLDSGKKAPFREPQPAPWALGQRNPLRVPERRAARNGLQDPRLRTTRRHASRLHHREA